MKLLHGLHLAYCTNIHRGETWDQTFDTLKRYTLKIRERVCPDATYGIGLRLGNEASKGLAELYALNEFKRWLKKEDCYIFTINGFPYGNFHGRHIKDEVYKPDWTSLDRVNYTNRLFDILAQLVPDDVEGSVSTVPVAYKKVISNDREARIARRHLWKCIDHIEQLSRSTGKKLHLGLEPEPLCYIENSEECVRFFEAMRRDRPGDLRLEDHLGVNYDCCHFAIQFENPHEALSRLLQHKIRISKIHISAALKLYPTFAAKKALQSYDNEVYLHQVIERDSSGFLRRFEDIEKALTASSNDELYHMKECIKEWRVHFHIPLHTPPNEHFETTSDHIKGTLDFVKKHPGLCSHFEMETYTWEVLPPALKLYNVIDQITYEYNWTISQMKERGLA